MKPSATSLLTNRLANSSDLTTVSSIVFSCATRLSNQHHPDWSRYYTLDRLQEKLNTQTAYLFFVTDQPIGVVFLSANDLYYYSENDLQKFADPSSSAIYISTLAVSPEHQHQGFATQIINFCERYALENKINYLRLDCNSHDKPLVEFYKKRGFVVMSPMEKEPEYLLLEKSI